MKESELIKMRKEIESITSVIKYLLSETTNLKDLSVGTLELVKNFPEYTNALERLKQDLIKEKEVKPKKTKKKLE
jgi:hypothetical protein